MAFDEDRLQFVADIKATDNDPDYLYVLSSRFQKYFLKNLDNSDINVRILVLPDSTVKGAPLPLPSPTPTKHSLASSYAYSFAPHRHYLPFTSTQHQLPQHKYSTPPYPFEPVGILNNQIHNPFLALNRGENPHITPQKFSGGNLLGPHFTSFRSDFNGLRFAKSLFDSTNVTSIPSS